MSYVRFWVLWLAEHVRKSTQYWLNKFGPLTPKKITDGEKIILKLLFLSRRPVLIKSEELSNKKMGENDLYFIPEAPVGKARTKNY